MVRTSLKQKICSTCGRTFYHNKTKDHRWKKRKFCSRVCSGKSHIGKEIPLSQREQSSQWWKNFYKENPEQLKKVQTFLRKQSLLRKGIKRPPEIGIAMSIARKGKKLTEAHKLALRIAHPRLRGEKSPHWQGGKKIESERLRSSLEYHIWRKEVYQRDRWSCRMCGVKCTAKTIIAHHIKLFSKFPELRFSVDNGLTLCRSCHIKIHKPKNNG